MTQGQLLKRVELLERELDSVKRQVATMQGKSLTSNDFIGVFRGDKYFKEAMELGAAYRRSLKPHRPKGKTRKK